MVSIISTPSQSFSIFISPLAITDQKTPTLTKSHLLSHESLSLPLSLPPTPHLHLCNWICLKENTVMVTGPYLKSRPQTNSLTLMLPVMYFYQLFHTFSLLKPPKPLAFLKISWLLLISIKKILSTNLLIFCTCSHMPGLPFYNMTLCIIRSHFFPQFPFYKYLPFSCITSFSFSTYSSSSAFTHASILKYLCCLHILL